MVSPSVYAVFFPRLSILSSDDCYFTLVLQHEVKIRTEIKCSAIQYVKIVKAGDCLVVVAHWWLPGALGSVHGNYQLLYFHLITEDVFIFY